MKLIRLASLVFALSVAPTAMGLALADSIPLPERNPQRAPQTDPGAGATVPWGESKVAEARAECNELLADVDIEYEMLPPIKRGICGTPAPILVKSIGNPKVTISPPATINCKLAVALNDWMKDKVQPQAIETFGRKVIRLRNAASYACRNRNSNPNGRLSEHAKANALDISEFILEGSVRITVLDSWPRVYVAPAPPLPEPNPVRVAEATTPTLPVLAASYVLPPKPRLSPVSHVKVLIGNTTEVAKIKVNPFVVATPSPPPVLATPSLLAPADPPRREVRPEYKSEFVRSIYAEACDNFGTTLGPNADAAHRNHFHFDMKYRRAGYCR